VPLHALQYAGKAPAKASDSAWVPDIDFRSIEVCKVADAAVHSLGCACAVQVLAICRTLPKAAGGFDVTGLLDRL